jgi:hypothetical protein
LLILMHWCPATGLMPAMLGVQKTNATERFPDQSHLMIFIWWRSYLAGIALSAASK